MFYHVIVEEKNNNNKYFIYDLTDKNIVIDTIIKPFQLCLELNLDGHHIKKNEIKNIFVKETEISIKELVKKANSNAKNKSISIMRTREIMLTDKKTVNDITNEIFDEFKVK